MGRAAITLGASDGRPRVLDRSGDGATRLGPGPTRNPTSGAPGAGTFLSGAKATPTFEEMFAGQEVDLSQIWAQLSLPDRQCFGHRFSGMVLKALGLRRCQSQETDR
jgi:hypothetical protein